MRRVPNRPGTVSRPKQIAQCTSAQNVFVSSLFKSAAADQQQPRGWLSLERVGRGAQVQERTEQNTPRLRTGSERTRAIRGRHNNRASTNSFPGELSRRITQVKGDAARELAQNPDP